MPNDNYFHFYIGYHLREAGTQYQDLFKMLYYDFGFLEQKLRYSGLSNTLGDFKYYSNEILNKNKPQEDLTELTDFLAYIEEFLSTSDDTCLLQYALSKDNAIEKKAQQQAQQFKSRIWFSDM